VLLRSHRAVPALVAAAAVVLAVAGCGSDEGDFDASSSSTSSSGGSGSSYDYGSSSGSSSTGSGVGGRAGFARDMRALLGSGLQVNDDGLAEIGEGICVWYTDGVSYAKALDSMAFMNATPSQSRSVLLSAASNLCPGAWGLGGGSAGSVTAAEPPATVPEPVEPEPVEAIEPPPAPAYEPPPAYTPPPVPACPKVGNITVTAKLVGLTPFADSSHGITLNGWKYKVATTVRNAGSVGAAVITAVEVHGADGIIDSEVGSVEVHAGKTETVTSLEFVEYDSQPVKTVVDPIDSYSVSGLEHCE